MSNFFGETAVKAKKKKKKKSKMPDDAPFFKGLTSDEEEPKLKTDEHKPEGAKVTHVSTEGPIRKIRIDLDYRTRGLDVGSVLQEAVSMKEVIPDWDLERWARFMHTVGAVPFHIIWTDVEHYYQLIFAAEVLRRAKLDPEQDAIVTSTLKYLPRNGFSPDTHNEKQQGKRWGQVDEDEPVPIKDQMDQKHKKLIDDNRKGVIAAEPQGSKADTLAYRWTQAERVAAKVPMAKWMGQLNPDFESMVRYCYSMLREIGEVPEYPKTLNDIFWDRERVDVSDEKVNARRATIAGKVMKLFHTIRAERKSEDKEFSFVRATYRRVLTAMALSRVIETYAATGSKIKREGMKPKIRRAVRDYYDSHLPIPNPPKGPVEQYDPPYSTYLQTCLKYNLEDGSLLHEVLQEKGG